MTDYSANGHFEYGVFFKGGAIPWVATLVESDAEAVVQALTGYDSVGWEVRPL